MKVLTLETQGERTEIHMLNPGEHFEGFGGSRHDLVVGRTASMVVRQIGPMGTRDHEQDIHEPAFWEWIGRMINGQVKATAVAS